MNIIYLIHFVGDHLLFFVLGMNALGVGVLVKSMFTQDQQIRHQRMVNAQIRAHVADCLKAQITSFDQVDSLQERCAKLLARQQLVEKRGPDAQRIELANRMLRRGSVDLATLHDLGLTNSEIKLLTRLHAVTQTTKACSPEQPKKSGDDERVAPMTFDKPVLPTTSQGQALARLFETGAVAD